METKISREIFDNSNIEVGSTVTVSDELDLDSSDTAASSAAIKAVNEKAEEAFAAARSAMSAAEGKLSNTDYATNVGAGVARIATQSEVENFTTEGEIPAFLTPELLEEFRPAAKSVGEVFYSLLPINDGTVHLLDGTTIINNGIYQKFIEHVTTLYADSHYSYLFCTNEEFEASLAANGSCGKFVFDPSTGNVRLPRITGIIEGTILDGQSGDIEEKGYLGSSGVSRLTTTRCYLYIVLATKRTTDYDLAVDSLTTEINNLRSRINSMGGGVYIEPDWCVGVTRAADGRWSYVDKDGNALAPERRYFEQHPVFGGIDDVSVSGQYMVRIPKFYIKNDNHNSLWISPTKVDDTYKCHPAFVKYGVEQKYIYLGKYAATDEGDNKAGSQPGKAPWTTVTFTDFDTYCKNQPGFRMWDIYHISALQYLALIEYCTPDVQSAIARGNVDGSGSVVNTDAALNQQASYHGIVGLWGNMWQWVDGLQCIANSVEIFDNQGNRSWIHTGIDVPVYNGVSWRPTVDCGWVTAMATNRGTSYNMNDIFFPIEPYAENEEDGKYGAYFWGSYGTTKCMFGGNWGSGSGAGLFTYALQNPPLHANNSVGTRLALL